MQLELEEIVGQLGDIVQVGKKIAYPHLRKFRHHFLVAGRHGFQHDPIQAFIEAVDGAVHRFQRIARITVARTAGQIQGQECHEQDRVGFHGMRRCVLLPGWRQADSLLEHGDPRKPASG